MTKGQQIGIRIDKLTRSIENSISGDSFKTQILPATPSNLKGIKTKDWLFDWKAESKFEKRTIYKLVIVDNPDVIQGLISIEDRGDHIFMHLIESNKYNRGKGKLYLGVPGNLIAFICLQSFERKYNGFVSFESKTKLISHYQKSLGSKVLFGNFMVLETAAAIKIVNHYFPDYSYL